MVDKKELIRHYKQNPQPMGIFQIRNISSGKVYVVGAKDLHAKINRMKFQLKSGIHFCKELQDDYNRAGEGDFAFEVLDYLKPREDPTIDYADELKLLEEMWLEKLQPYGDKGYHRRK
jgi:hypothetical protein